MPDETEITDRLARLEADLRRWRWVAVVAGVLAIGALALAVRTLRTPAELQIAGADGAKLILRADNLAFVDGKGEVIAGIDTDHHFGKLALYGEPGVIVQAAATTVASINLTAKGAHNAAVTAGDHATELSLTHGTEHASLETADNLAATLRLGGSDARGMVSLTNGGLALYPRLQLSAKGTSPSVALEANPKGADLQLDDASASRRLTTEP